ncbi:MAG: RDD family protein [Granulosicoccaceae bacterium]
MSDDHFTPPVANIVADLEPVYAGFWRRVFATLIDTVIAMLVMIPVMMMLLGNDFLSQDTLAMPDTQTLLLEYILPLAVTVFLWVRFRATPGKMVLGCQVVHAETGENIGVARAIVRYLAYFVSGIVLGLGFIWVLFNKRKRGWHDIIAGTVVIRKAS